MKSPWLLLGNGERFDLLNPERAHIGTIAPSLSMNNRFTGHTMMPYSVAQHSCHVADLLARRADLPQPLAEFYGLTHDMHEHLTGDLSSPMKQAMALRLPGFKRAWDDLTDGLDDLIYQGLGLNDRPDEKMREAIRWADLAMLGIEIRDLFRDGPAKRAAMQGLPEISHPPIRPLPWDKAMELFTKRVARCQRALGLTLGMSSFGPGSLMR